MTILIGRHAWTAKHIWIEKGRLYWLSPSGRQHSRKLRGLELQVR